MTATILSILAALLPLLLEGWDAYRRRDTQYAAKQTLRRAITLGDSATVSRRIDELREKSARRRVGG